MLNRSRTGAAIAATIVSGVLSFMGYGGSSSAAVTPVSVSSEPSAADPAVQFLMDDLNLTVAEASKRKHDIDFLSELRFEDIDPEFVAIEIEPAHELVATYQSLASTIPAVVTDTLRGATVAVQLNLQTVPRSWQEVQDAKLSLAARMKGKADIRGDLALGQVVATVASAKDIPPGLTRIDRVPVRWRQGEMFETQANGGRGWGSCTVGFVVKSTSSSQRGISTAAHCSNAGVYNGVSWIYMNGHDGGSYDVAWYKPAVSTPLENSISCCGGAYSVINDRKWVAGMDVGVPACKMGKETQFHCGYITDTYVCFNEPIGCTYFAYAKSGVDVAEPGDSGGPVFYDQKAYGWHVAGSGYTGLYMPQQYSPSYGFEVAIS